MSVGDFYIINNVIMSFSYSNASIKAPSAAIRNLDVSTIRILPKEGGELSDIFDAVKKDIGLTQEQIDLLSIFASAEGRNVPINADGTFSTTIGHTYAVESDTDEVLITNANNKPLCKLTPAGQVGFVANTTTCKSSTTNCTITEVFKAAAPITLGGGGIDLAWRYKYDECVSVSDMQAINSDYKNDLQNGEWLYLLSNLQNATGAFQNAANLVRFVVKLPKITVLSRIVTACSKLEYLELSLNGQDVTEGYDIASKTPKLKKIKITGVGAFNNSTSSFHNNGNTTVLEDFELQCVSIQSIGAWFYNDTALKKVVILAADTIQNANNAYYNCRALQEFPTSYKNLNAGTNMFAGCCMSATQAISILNSLPSYTSGSRSITMGIHVDYQNNSNVANAVAIAEAKGWTVTVQWNGTPGTSTASTFGLRRQTIYARTAEMETPDGMETVLDWGHYVTNWEENGYLEFSSVEEACEYWGLEPYVDPEWEDELMVSE
jgi:hypothetical protein